MAARVRRGMHWKSTGYLFRTLRSGAEKSLGPHSADTEKMFERFDDRKKESVQRLASLESSLDDQRRLNRGLRLGRVNPFITDLLSRPAATALAEHFRVVGTHALYAYEAEAGVILDAEAVATRELDLLWDFERRAQFATALKRVDTSMLGRPEEGRRVVPGRKAQKHTAVNKDGFEFEIIGSKPIEDDRPASYAPR